MQPAIARDRTAMRRTEASRPVRLAADQQVIRHDRSVLDYGCGHGADVEFLAGLGIEVSGWDPVHRPTTSLQPADVVNLGYVVNVIEAPEERADVLRAAWSLARCALVVSARLVHEERLRQATTWADGVVTSKGTFQKFYEQAELRAWIESTLGEPATAATPGTFYVFRDANEREELLATRFRRRAIVARVRQSEQLFREHEQLLQPLLAFMGDRGRPPVDGELADEAAVVAAFGTVSRAVAVLRRVFGADHWSAAEARRRDDLLVYLALAQFGGRPRKSELAPAIREDVRALFGAYKTACQMADELLFGVSDAEGLLRSATAASVGKLTPMAFYVHRDYLDELPPTLRVYEGCARSLVGDVPDANIVKLALSKYQVSYLSYPAFDRDPHPALAQSVVVKLQALDVRYRSFDGDNPPVLHRKELFVGQDDARFATFRRLTEQEERYGLLDDTRTIGTRAGWEAVLDQHGVRVKGHRVVRTR